MATSAQINSIVALYAGYFDRAPDPAGLQFWIDQIDAGREFATIAADFAKSPEAQALYPFLTVPDVATAATFVTSVYANLFGRTPDAEGLAFWTKVITDGTVPVGDMIQSIINGAVTAPDSTVLANKQAVGLDFATDAGNVAGFTLDTAALAAAKAAMDGVTADEASVTAAKAATDAFFGSATTGSTQALTISVDALTGTNLNDTFNATPINAISGAVASTLTAFDKIDGGDGKDTLNIIINGGRNNALPAGVEVKNVEVINFLATDGTTFGGGTGTIDASKFVGSTEIWQIGDAAATINNVASTQTIGASGTTNATAATVNMLAAATSFTGAGKNVAEGSTLNVVSGATGTLNSVTVSGTVADNNNIAGSGAATNNDGTIIAGNLNVTVGKDVETLSVSTTGPTVLAVTDGAGTKKVSTVDASASTGNLTYVAAATVSTITTGTGADAVTVKTTGTGPATVNTGDGKDTVTVDGAGTTGVLTVNLGTGDDNLQLTGGAVIGAKDVIDGGEGSDTLLLSSVGAANIGAFSNFEVFDVKGLGKTLDVDILATKNTVTEFVASGDAGAGATLTNIGAGIGLRVTADTTANDIILTQKAAGALTVTLDADTTATTENDDSTDVVATNATSLKAVFDTSSVFKQTAANKNDQNIDLTGTKATTLEIVSGGVEATNQLDYTGADNTAAGKGDLLTSVTVTGDQKLGFTYAAADATEITTFNASESTGGLVINLDAIKDTGTVTLGSGDDTISAQAVAADAATAIAEHVKLAGLEKGSAEGLTSATGLDTIAFAGAVNEIQAIDNATGTADASVVNGKVTFKGTGPATLTEAVTDVQALIGANEVAVFEYVGNSYIFSEGADGAGGDTLIELTGTTGLTGIGEVGATDAFYIF